MNGLLMVPCSQGDDGTRWMLERGKRCSAAVTQFLVAEVSNDTHTERNVNNYPREIKGCRVRYIVKHRFARQVISC